jgi:hypothetical protein
MDHRVQDLESTPALEPGVGRQVLRRDDPILLDQLV